MSILNHDLDIGNVPDAVRTAFSGGQARKQYLAVGHELYKFTQYPLFGEDGRVTPWWSSVKPLDPRDSGLDGTVARAEKLGITGSDFARALTATDKKWNAMSGFLRIRLIKSTYGIYGRCAHQFYDSNLPHLANVVWIGGAWQLYIPNLSREYVSSF